MSNIPADTPPVYEFLLGKSQYHLLDQMVAWCSEHLGEGGWTGLGAQTWAQHVLHAWGIHWGMGRGGMYFRHASDCTAFALRWSGATD